MRQKDRNQLHAVAKILGIDPKAKRGSKADPSRDHDWRRFLPAKVMYSDGRYEGPDWVPFSLWQATTYSPSDKFAKKLVFSPGARELWSLIEETYPRPNDVALQLPMRCAETAERWRLISKRTPSKHREQMLRLKANALAIAAEIDATEASESFETGTKFDFMRLYDDTEKAIVYQNVHLHNLRLRNVVLLEEQGKPLGFKRGDVMAPVTRTNLDDYTRAAQGHDNPNLSNGSLASIDARDTWELLIGDDERWPGIVPTVANQMRRLATYFDALSNEPPMQRPSYENAERNFYSRHICGYFHSSYGHVSPSIVARIICILFAQGITENEVSQQIAKLPGDLKDARMI